MGEHIDNRKSGKHKKKRVKENGDPFLARHQRVTFKNYLREVEKELLEEELEELENQGDEELDT